MVYSHALTTEVAQGGPKSLKWFILAPKRPWIMTPKSLLIAMCDACSCSSHVFQKCSVATWKVQLQPPSVKSQVASVVLIHGIAYRFQGGLKGSNLNQTRLVGAD